MLTSSILDLELNWINDWSTRPFILCICRTWISTNLPSYLFTYFFFYSGILHLRLTTESWINDRRTLKGLLSFLWSPSIARWSSLIALIMLLVMVLLYKWVKCRSNQKKLLGEYVYPPNCVHGYVNLDAAGHLLGRDSKHPPRWAVWSECNLTKEDEMIGYGRQNGALKSS